MKPRPRRAPLTFEDWAIWLAVNERMPRVRVRGEWQGLYSVSVLADRRDAEVMYRLGQIRQRFAVASIMMLGADKPTAPGVLAAGCRYDRDPGRSFELDYRP